MCAKPIQKKTITSIHLQQNSEICHSPTHKSTTASSNTPFFHNNTIHIPSANQRNQQTTGLTLKSIDDVHQQ